MVPMRQWNHYWEEMARAPSVRFVLKDGENEAFGAGLRSKDSSIKDRATYITPVGPRLQQIISTDWEMIILYTVIWEGKMGSAGLQDTYFSDKWCLGTLAHTRRCRHRGSRKPRFYSSRAGSSWGPSAPQHTRCHSGHLKGGTRARLREAGRAGASAAKWETRTKVTTSNLS